MDNTLTVWPRALLYGSMAIAVFLTFGLLYILQSGMSKPKSATLVFSAPLALESTRSVLQSVQLALSENDYRAGDISLDLVILEDGDETVDIPWNDPDSECTYMDCLYPSED